ncbi:hypothetical protein BKA56DRAFT_660018 [Ilyonectria sp. MPI-CAGE-AT-0026]|nr:hypothetical protein BKA56DRAFT_660018 [Ilyonectria sp. MPI-CAGE-AT-0026]
MQLPLVPSNSLHPLLNFPSPKQLRHVPINFNRFRIEVFRLLLGAEEAVSGRRRPSGCGRCQMIEVLRLLLGEEGAGSRQRRSGRFVGRCHVCHQQGHRALKCPRGPGRGPNGTLSRRQVRAMNNLAASYHLAPPGAANCCGVRGQGQGPVEGSFELALRNTEGSFKSLVQALVISYLFIPVGYLRYIKLLQSR